METASDTRNLIKKFEYNARPVVQAVQWNNTLAAVEAIQSLIGHDNVQFGVDMLRIKAGPEGESGWVTVPLKSWVVYKSGDAWPCRDKPFLENYKEIA